MEVVDRDKAGIGVYGAIISITAEFRTAEQSGQLVSSSDVLGSDGDFLAGSFTIEN